MARLSISEAARKSGLSRQYFHKLINKGVVTAAVDEQGNKYIDDAELLRAFEGRLPKTKPPSTKETVNKDVITAVSLQRETPGVNATIISLQTEVNLLREQLSKTDVQEKSEISLLREQLRKSEEREQRLMSQVDKLADTIKLIEHKNDGERWWNKKLW